MATRPEIRYVTSADGTRLAMSLHGSGPPLVQVSMQLGDRLEDPSCASRHYHRDLSQHHCFVRFDARGCGLSDHQVERLDFEACLEDLEAVVDAVTRGPIDLYALSHGTPLAVEFAARHPERVRRFVIYNGYARGRLRRPCGEAQLLEAQAILQSTRVAFGPAVASRQALFRAINSRMFPGATLPQLEELDHAVCDRHSGDAAVAYAQMLFDLDVSDQARRLQCPVLAFQSRRDESMVPFEEGRLLASLIPDEFFDDYRVALDRMARARLAGLGDARLLELLPQQDDLPFAHARPKFPTVREPAAIALTARMFESSWRDERLAIQLARLIAPG